MNYPVRVLFLCTHNSARSQMAEALLRHLGGKDFEAYSAGNNPTGLNPYAVAVMAERGIDISQQQSKSVDQFLGQEFDFVITVCDRAKQTCPVFPGDPKQIHWSFDDPSEVQGDEETKLRAFRQTATFMTNRVQALILTQRKILREMGLVKPPAAVAWVANTEEKVQSDESQIAFEIGKK